MSANTRHALMQANGLLKERAAISEGSYSRAQPTSLGSFDIPSSNQYLSIEDHLPKATHEEQLWLEQLNISTGSKFTVMHGLHGGRSYFKSVQIKELTVLGINQFGAIVFDSDTSKVITLHYSALTVLLTRGDLVRIN